MNYTMITNHAHARTNPPLGDPESKKIGTPILKFPSAKFKISTTINLFMYKYGT